MKILSKKYEAWLKHYSKYTAKQVIEQVLADIEQVEEEKTKQALTLTNVSITEGELCEICNENEAKVIYKTCYACEEYIIKGEHN